MEHSLGRRRRQWPALVTDAALLAVICISVYWKIVLTRQYTYLETPDLAYQVLPWFQFQAAEWHRGHVPLWDPHLWGGQTLIGQAQPGAAYPLNWILFALPLRDGFLRIGYLHWYLVFVHFLGAWFAYLLCRDLGRSRGASVIGGALFSLAGWLAQNDLPQMINGAIWTPLVFLFLLRALRGQRAVRSAALSGALYGVCWLAGHHQIPLFVGVAVAGIWLVAAFRTGRPEWKVLRLACIFGLFAVLVSGLQTLPAYEYGRLAKRWVGAQEPKGWDEPVPYSVHADYSLQPSSLIGLFIPGHGKHFDLYAGVLALALALVGLRRFWSEPAVRTLAAVGVGGLFFALGKNNLLHGVVYALAPMVEKARTPAFAAFLYQFAFSTLAAYGIDSYRSADGAQWRQWVWRSVGIFGLLLLGFGAGLAIVGKLPVDDRFLVTGLVAVLGGALLWAWGSGRVTARFGVAAVGVLALIEIGNVTGYFWPNREELQDKSLLRKLRQHDDIARFIKTLPGLVRCQIPEREIPYNFGDWHGVDQFGGYTASLPVNLLRVPWAGERGRELFGVNCVVAAAPPEGAPQEAFVGASGLKVYWQPEAYPRVWTVHEARKLDSVYQIEAAFQGQVRLREATFVLEAPPALEQCAEPDRVEVIGRSTGRLVLQAQMGCRGMVVVGDSYFPGWRATVDGRPAKIWEAYTAVRGVVVEKGSHRVEMVYLPASVFVGLAMTVIGLAGALTVGLWPRREEA